MLCEKCGQKEATFYYHENVNGQERSYKLCRSCAKEMESSGAFGTAESHGFGDAWWSEGFFADPFKSMSTLLSGVLGGGRQTEEKRCPDCGLRFREFASAGMAGCPRCYEAFEKELENTVYKLHGHASHRGRVPARLQAEQDLKSRVEALEKERDQAVLAEDYERAAAIRDQLKLLREQGNS